MSGVAVDRGGFSQKPVAECAHCHRLFTVNRDGSIRAHGPHCPPRPRHTANPKWCHGVYQEPIR